jgi:4-amino-4-deoxy-L-arabinose transferase-like glycosyltransferase
VEPVPARTDPAASRRPAAGGELRRSDWRHSYRLGLLAVLVVQAALALRLVWSNTAFQDEAQYLWFGHMEWRHWLHGTPLPANDFSGAPVVYPPLGALADSVGGLAGARLLSLLFMLGATALLYACAARIFSKGVGLIAAAMFVAVGPTADISAWATYDPMAIFLMALSTWLAVRAARSRITEPWIFLAAAVMVLADASKWVTGLWNPVIVALVVLTAPTNWALALARGVRMVSYAVAIAALALFVFGGAQYLVQISDTTTDRGTGGTPQWSVLWTAAPMVAAILLLALLGVLLSWREHRDRRTLLCLVLVAAVLLAPLLEAHDQTTVSLYKHVVYGAWFGAIGAGYALSKAAVINASKGWRVGLAAAVFTGLVGFDQATFWYGLWPNSKPLMAAVEHLLPARGPMLMQDGDGSVALYYLSPLGIHPDVMTSYAYSPAAISSMIASHRLWMVETDVGTGTPLGSMQLSVAGSPAKMERAGYRRVSRIRWRDPDGAVGWFTIWLLKPARGGLT